MKHLQFRLFALGIAALFAGLTWYNWYKLSAEGRFYTQMAVFGPLGVVFGIFLMLFPQYGGRPETTTARVVVLLVFVVGLAAGLYNMYLMDPSFFGQ